MQVCVNDFITSIHNLSKTETLIPLVLLDRVEKKALACRRQHQRQERINERWFQRDSQFIDNAKQHKTSYWTDTRPPPPSHY